MRSKQFFAILYFLFSLYSCKPDKDVTPTDAQKIIGEWKREFVDGGTNNRLDTLKYTKDSVFTRTSRFKYVLKNDSIMHLDGNDIVYNVPLKFEGADNIRMECYYQIGVVCYFNLTRIK